MEISTLEAWRNGWLQSLTSSWETPRRWFSATWSLSASGPSQHRSLLRPESSVAFEMLVFLKMSPQIVSASKPFLFICASYCISDLPITEVSWLKTLWFIQNPVVVIGTWGFKRQSLLYKSLKLSEMWGSNIYRLNHMCHLYSEPSGPGKWTPEFPKDRILESWELRSRGAVGRAGEEAFPLCWLPAATLLGRHCKQGPHQGIKCKTK